MVQDEDEDDGDERMPQNDTSDDPMLQSGSTPLPPERNDVVPTIAAAEQQDGIIRTGIQYHEIDCNDGCSIDASSPILSISEQTQRQHCNAGNQQSEPFLSTSNAPVYFLPSGEAIDAKNTSQSIVEPTSTAMMPPNKPSQQLRFPTGEVIDAKNTTHGMAEPTTDVLPAMARRNTPPFGPDIAVEDCTIVHANASPRNMTHSPIDPSHNDNKKRFVAIHSHRPSSPQPTLRLANDTVNSRIVDDPAHDGSIIRPLADNDDTTTFNPEPTSTLMTAQLVNPDDIIIDSDNERARIIREARAAFAAEAVQAEAVPSPLQQQQDKKYRMLSIVGAIVICIGIVLAIVVALIIRPTQSTPILLYTATMSPSASPTPVPVIYTANGLRAFTTTLQLQEAADAYHQALLRQGESLEDSEVAREYGYPIGTWDVSRITDFGRIFDPDRSQFLDANRKPSVPSHFDEDLSGWDVSHATSMIGMFAAASNFTGQGLDTWNVSQVVDFSFMFAHAHRFNGNISKWNTSNAVLTRAMFFEARLFDGDLSKLDVSRVTSMQQMFQYAKAYRGGDLTQWDVKSVENMESMFANAGISDVDLSTWNTGKVTTMSTMFADSSFNGDLSSWSVENVQSMDGMFLSAINFRGGNLTGWNTSRVTVMSNMFFQAATFNGDVSTWDVSNVTTFYQAFSYSLQFEGDLSHWDTSSATIMTSMFSFADKFSSNISRWETGKVTNMNFMFHFAVSFDSDLSAWDVSRLQYAESMFSNAKLFNSDMSSWDVSNLKSANAMFYLADTFNQSLCPWRDRLTPDTIVTAMFLDSGCAVEQDPDVSNLANSPMCSMCPS